MKRCSTRRRLLGLPERPPASHRALAPRQCGRPRPLRKAENAGGTRTVRGQPEEGATFTVSLPG